MNTDALIMMSISIGIIAFATIYYFVKVLKSASDKSLKNTTSK